MATVRRREPVDRSFRGFGSKTESQPDRTAEARIWKEPITPQVRKAIGKAGIPESNVDTVLEEIETAIVFYLGSKKSSGQFPTIGEQRIELQGLERRASALAEALKRLSERSRRKIQAAAHHAQREETATDQSLRSLLATIEAFSADARDALTDSRKKQDQRKKDEEFLNLLFGISLAWQRYGGQGAGVTKSDGNCRGALVELSATILRAELIRFQSLQSLARTLYAMRNRVGRKARESLEPLSAELKSEPTLREILTT